MKDKNFIAQKCCPICGDCIGIAFHKYMKDLPEKIITSPFLCDKCKERLTKEDHFIMYESLPPNRMGSNGLAIDIPQITGRWVEMSMEFFKNDQEDDQGYKFVKENRICFCDKEFFNKYLLKGLEKCQNKN